MTHWQVGDVVVFSRYRVAQAVPGIILKLYGPQNRPHHATVADYPDKKETHFINLDSIEIDPELTLRQASDWRAAGGRVEP